MAGRWRAIRAPSAHPFSASEDTGSPIPQRSSGEAADPPRLRLGGSADGGRGRSAANKGAKTPMEPVRPPIEPPTPKRPMKSERRYDRTSRDERPHQSTPPSKRSVQTSRRMRPHQPSLLPKHPHRYGRCGSAPIRVGQSSSRSKRIPGPAGVPLEAVTLGESARAPANPHLARRSSPCAPIELSTPWKAHSNTDHSCGGSIGSAHPTHHQVRRCSFPRIGMPKSNAPRGPNPPVGSLPRLSLPTKGKAPRNECGAHRRRVGRHEGPLPAPATPAPRRPLESPGPLRSRTRCTTDRRPVSPSPCAVPVHGVAPTGSRSPSRAF